MKYQYCIVGKNFGSADQPGYMFRRFRFPVVRDGDTWIADPAAVMLEETHLYTQDDLIEELEYWQIHTDNSAGGLDDLTCPSGWKVFARDWLPDDYRPPSEADVAKRHAEAVAFLKNLGLWKDKK